METSNSICSVSVIPYLISDIYLVDGVDRSVTERYGSDPTKQIDIKFVGRAWSRDMPGKNRWSSIWRLWDLEALEGLKN